MPAPLTAGLVVGRIAGQAALLLTLQAFAPRAWRAVKLTSLLWLLPWKRRHRAKLNPRFASVTAAVSPTVMALVLGFALLKRTAPDVARTLRFWNQYMPIHVRYTYTKLRYSERRGYKWKEVEAAWKRRHDWGASRVCKLLQNMSGYYVKSAQIMASKTDFLPVQWTQAMTPIFFDNMEPRHWHVVRQGLLEYLPETQLGTESITGPAGKDEVLEEIFASIPSVPLASASIAQVHEARLSASALAALGPAWRCGPDVVAKVQHLDMQGLMESDIRNLRRLCTFLRKVLPYDPTPLLDEMRDTVGKEFDFVREARLMRVIADRLRHDGLQIRIPQPLLQLTCPRLLVMQRMQGAILAKIPSASLRGIPFSEILQGSDPVLHRKAAKTIPVLMECYGRMIFRDGLFHADPHAGNLLLQDDGGVALLDFGQCKALPAARHAALARLIVAIDDGDDVRTALAMSAFGMDFSALGGGVPDPAVIRTVALIIFDTRPLREATIHPLADDAVIKQIPLKQAPEDLFSLGRTIMLLRGLCFSFDLNIQAAKVWRPYAEAALRNPKLAELAAENAKIDMGEN